MVRAKRGAIRMGEATGVFGRRRGLIVIALIVAVAAGAVALGAGQTGERLGRDGVLTQARVVALNAEELPLGDSDERAPRTAYHAEVTYVVAGDEVTVAQQVSAGFYRGLAVGDRIPVRYWREDPLVVEVEPKSLAATRWAATVVSALALALAGAMLLGQRRRGG